MGSADYRGEIPTRSFVNARIIDKAVQTDSFDECVRLTLAEFGAPAAEYQFKNPAYIAGLLYCLVVVPKEIWLLPPNHGVYKHLEAKGIVDLFTITLKDSKFDSHPTYYLIHRLRNAIAHADFSIDQSQDFEFRDRKKKDSSPHWKASVSNANLFVFISRLGQISDGLRRMGQSED